MDRRASPPVFAVFDGIGTWEQDNQLCVAQQGKTPLLSAWSTTTNWTNLGSPYLWWTGADMAPVLDRDRAVGAQLGPSRSRQEGRAWSCPTRPPTRRRSNDYLLPDLKKAGITPAVDTIAGNPDETSTTNSEAQLAVERIKSAGVQSVFPLLPENAFFPYLAAEASQQYIPQLLLSDYQSTIEVALGLIPTPYEKELDGQEGVTTETLGGFDDARPESQGGYDPGVRSCYSTWHTFHPKPIAGTHEHLHRGTRTRSRPGVGRSVSSPRQRRMPGPLSTGARSSKPCPRSPITRARSHPSWSFGPDKFYGPTQYQVVKIHNNVPPSSQCKLKTNHQPQGTCWVTEQPFKPLPGASS